MGVNMNQGDLDNNVSFLQIKELKEKVRNLVSEVDLNRENAKFKHEKNVDNDLSDSVSSEEDDDEFVDCSVIELLDDTVWLTGGEPEPLSEVCKRVYAGIDDNLPDVSDLCRQLQMSSITNRNVFSHPGVPIDSRTFTRPKKFSTRPSLTSVINTDEGRPKLQRHLTTTISPTPNLISKLEELSRNNNRPVSGNNEYLYNEDGAEETMADLQKPNLKANRQSLPASLFERLQELKRANSTFKIPNSDDQNLASKKVQEEEKKDTLPETNNPALIPNFDLKNSHSTRLSEIFRNIQDCYSDDNESFISLDEVSGFCDRLILSTDQNTYSSIMKEMEQHDICLFHRTPNDSVTQDGNITFGGIEIPRANFPKSKSEEQLIEKDNDLNRTYEIDDEEAQNLNNTFELKNNSSKHNIMNTTYDADKKPGLVDTILNTHALEDAPLNKSSKKGSENIRNNNSANNNLMPTGFSENNMMNYTYDKANGTLNQNELNVLHSEKYSTKVFDSSFKKRNVEIVKSPTNRNNGKKESDYSEDDCMSTTSDNSCRSTDSNFEAKNADYRRIVGGQQKKKMSSTPIMGDSKKFDFDVVSPIRMESGDGESNTYSNSSSRGQSPKKIAPSYQQSDNLQKHRMPNLKQPLKVPQRELKLKPALVRPSQNFKRPLSYTRTSSEPSVPQKVESFQPAASVPTLRPLGPTSVPSLTNVRPSSRTSGIPRPPTRLKQPQIRVNYSKK